MSEELSGAEIRTLRKRLGLTQEKFAQAIAVTFSTVNRWENGHARIRKLTRRKLEALMARDATPARTDSFG